MADELIDSMSGLRNKASLDAHIASLAVTDAFHPVIVLFIDIDHFKEINDTLGHATGDEVIRQVGAILGASTARYTNAASYRYAGDEFVLVLNGYSRAEATALGNRTAEAIARITIPGLSRKVTTSIGAADSPPTDLASLVLNADDAMLDVKRKGGNRLQFYEPAHVAPATRRLVLNPQLFGVLDKTLRIAFIRTLRYHRAIEFLNHNPNLRLKCLSVLGPKDLLVFHLGDREHQFLRDLKPLVDHADSGEGSGGVHYFELTRCLKYHGYNIGEGEPPRPPDTPTLAQLVSLADGRTVTAIDDAEVRHWIDAGFALGWESTDNRSATIETYMTVDVLSGPMSDLAPELFEIVIKQFLQTNPHVFSLYEGHAARENIQYVIRTRSAPSELFDFIEILHQKCYELLMPRIHTSTFMVVRSRPLRMYQSLLIPVLGAMEKYVRDDVIGKALTSSQHSEFVLTDSEVQKLMITQVTRLEEAFKTMKIPAQYLSVAEMQELKNVGVHAVVTGDLKEIGRVYMELFKAIEHALKDCAVTTVRASYSDLADAVRDKVISQQAASKKLDRLAFGEVRDILKAVHQHRPDAATYLPPTNLLDQLQPAIDLRNQLSHRGDAVKPEDASRILVDLVDLVNRYSEVIFRYADGARGAH